MEECVKPTIKRKLALTVLGLALCGFVQLAPCASDSFADTITAAQLNEMTSLVKVTIGDGEPLAATGLIKSKLKLHKLKGPAIAGELVIVLEDLPSEVKLANASGHIGAAPYIYVPGGFPNTTAVTSPSPSAIRPTSPSPLLRPSTS